MDHLENTAIHPVDKSTFDKAYVLGFMEKLLNTDSPTGFTRAAIDYLDAEAERLGYTMKRSRKGNGWIYVPGHEEKTVGVCAHVDTLGLMVRSIKESGTLAFTTLGGPILPTLDGAYCRICTREGKSYTGTVICNSPAVHVYRDAAERKRDADNMEIRIDEEVHSKEDVLALGINAGDFVCIDTKTQITESDFIKSRFLDDKASVAVLFGVLQAWHAEGVKPRYNTYFLFSTYEEVGHGMANIPSEIEELLAVDMGCIGDDLCCTEYDVSICAKDSTGPYDHEMTTRLIRLAKEHALSYAVDIYPFYGSDASAALSGGNDIRTALIGPGVHASHGMERTHYKGVENAMQLVSLFLRQC